MWDSFYLSPLRQLYILSPEGKINYNGICLSAYLRLTHIRMTMNWMCLHARRLHARAMRTRTTTNAPPAAGPLQGQDAFCVAVAIISNRRLRRLLIPVNTCLGGSPSSPASRCRCNVSLRLCTSADVGMQWGGCLSRGLKPYLK